MQHATYDRIIFSAGSRRRADLLDDIEQIYVVRTHAGNVYIGNFVRNNWDPSNKIASLRGVFKKSFF